MNRIPKPALPRRRRAPVQADLPLPEPDTGPWSDDEAPETQLPWWQRRTAVLALASVAILLLVSTVMSQLAARRERAAAAEFAQQVRTLTLRPPTTTRGLRVMPNTRSWSAAPDAVLAWPEPPELVELRIPVGYTKFQTFAVTIDKVDQGRMFVLHRVAADSNRDVRLALNSTAFGPGEYRIKVEGYTWRGQRVETGWVRLVVRSPP